MDISTALDLCSKLATELWNFANTNFSAALFGALFGAYGAQKIADKAKSRETLLREIRNTNAAIAVSWSIASACINMKEKVTNPAKNAFDKKRAELEKLRELRKTAPEAPPTIFSLTADFQTFEPMRLPIDVLQELVFDKISLTGRPLVLATVVNQTIQSLNTFINMRNDLCLYFREKSPWASGELATIYLGVPDENGNIDQRYSSSLNAICDKIDDGIFFNQLLQKDLIAHGNKLGAKLGRTAPRVNQTDFSPVEKKGLMPPAENYETWFTAFEKQG